jgi:hypothetical protein
MTYAEFQEHWEKASSAERQQYESVPIEKLISLVENHDYGKYYQIWPVLGSKAAIEDVGPLLVEILKSDIDYLTRYHCAGCLLMIFNPFPSLFRPEKLSAREKYYVDQHIEEYEEEMKKKLKESTG